jgi:hypothetical protein
MGSPRDIARRNPNLKGAKWRSAAQQPAAQQPAAQQPAAQQPATRRPSSAGGLDVDKQWRELLNDQAPNQDTPDGDER